MLVADDDDVLDGELAVVVVLVDPLVQLVETLRVGDVEHQHAAVGASVVTRRQRAKALLARRVPQLQPHAQILRAVQERAGLAVDANRCIIRSLIIKRSIVSYAHEQRCLASERVANYNDFELLVELLLRLKYLVVFRGPSCRRLTSRL